MVRCHLCSKRGSPSSSGRVHPRPPTRGPRHGESSAAAEGGAPEGGSLSVCILSTSHRSQVVPSQIVFFHARVEVE